MKLDLTSKYILGIVGIVALVGIVVMIMNSAGDFSTTDVSGQATAKAYSIVCIDGDDNGRDPYVEGNAYTTYISNIGKNVMYQYLKLDSANETCVSSSTLQEVYCSGNEIITEEVDCATLSPSSYCREEHCVRK